MTESAIINVPDEFRKMALRMHQDTYLEVSSDAEIISYIADVPTTAERKRVIGFMEELLGSDLSGEQLSDLWANSGADWYVKDEDARTFYSALLEELRKRQSS